MENVQERIFETAEDMFLRFGIRSITMDEIADKLGISKKTLYQVVENKSDLIERTIQNHVTHESSCIQDIHEKSVNSIDELFQIASYTIVLLQKLSPTTVHDLKKYYQSIWKNLEDFHQQHIYNTIVNNIESGQKAGLYLTNIKSDIVARFYVLFSMQIVNEDIFPSGKIDKKEALVEFINYHIRAIATPKGIVQLEKSAQLLNAS